ncbi:hypothetical protein BB559_005416 [Furculomyces boomerangus]|uniref:EH domain-containing protein n=2 Tax=Harpellales TaxID=61421 RepID=A0A2T9Y8Q4_9FUNG|nr:hypothetical protein BB559_005416 [Furculomyces boomerangus]PVZ97024.1 hypothetical protein BB558_007045 [Smittium angustum]
MLAKKNKSHSQVNEALKTNEVIYEETVKELQDVYMNKIAPLEKAYGFEMFNSSTLTKRDISARPMILLLGQYSTGKTTFLEYLLGEEYPGSYVGIEPTTDKFTAVMYGSEKKIIPGHAAAVSGELPFSSLQKFGGSFLSRFQVSQLDNPLLKNLTIIDTPGILSGSKQMERGYNFTKAMNWFGERADLILMLFDGHKLDISDEFRNTIEGLKGQEEKTRIILNKCDQVDQQQLMRVYGALMWSLGKVIMTPEVNRVYLSSFWPASKPALHHRYEETHSLLEKEQKDLLLHLKNIPRTAALRRVNDMVKRTRQAKVHAYIIGHLKNEMPAVFGKNKRAKELINGLESEFVIIQHKYGLSPGDFPKVEDFKKVLRSHDLSTFKKLDPKLLNSAETALSVDFATLMNKFPTTMVQQANVNLDQTSSVLRTLPPPYSALIENSFTNATSSSSNPFGPGVLNTPGDDDPASLRFIGLFAEHSDKKTKLISGKIASSLMESTGLERANLRKVWEIADWDTRGSLDTIQFEVAMRICEKMIANIPIYEAEQTTFRELGLR